ncbi:Pdia3, partial [Symbiodinium pilosum]
MAGDKQMMTAVDDQKRQFEELKVAVGKLLPNAEKDVADAMAKMVRGGKNQDGMEEFLSRLQPEEGSQGPQAPEGKSAEKQSADKERKVKKLAKGLALHSATVELMLDCFDNYVVLKRLSEDSAAYTNNS